MDNRERQILDAVRLARRITWINGHIPMAQMKELVDLVAPIRIDGDPKTLHEKLTWMCEGCEMCRHGTDPSTDCPVPDEYRLTDAERAHLQRKGVNPPENR